MIPQFFLRFHSLKITCKKKHPLYFWSFNKLWDRNFHWRSPLEVTRWHHFLIFADNFKNRFLVHQYVSVAIQLIGNLISSSNIISSRISLQPRFNFLPCLDHNPPPTNYSKGKNREASTLLKESHNNHLKQKAQIFF